jgi:signal transduction histidine kinase
MDADDLFAAVAHEVKTPLAVVRGYAELLVSGTDGREAPAAILEAAERLAPAIDDLLLALEIESGVLEPEWEPIALTDVVPGAPRLPAVRGDAILLRRAVRIISRDAGEVSVTVDGGAVTIATDSVPRSRLELYVAGRIAALHAGELREAAGGVTLTLPLLAS